MNLKTAGHVSLLTIVLFFLLLFGCKKEDESVDLTVDQTEISLNPGDSIIVKITSGNGGYLVNSKDETVATATINDDEITIHASGNKNGGKTIVYVYDSKGMKERITVTVAEVFDITVDEASPTISIGGDKTITVLTGNGDYSVDFSDEAFQKLVELNTDSLANNNSFTITGISEGTATLIISDGKGKTLTFSVIIKRGVITVDQSNISLVGSQSAGVISILSGSGNYELSFSKEGIANATVSNDVITITPVSSGNTELTVTGSQGDLVIIPVTVNVDLAANLASNYCLTIDMANSAQAEELKSLKQVTYEITFYADYTRGLMTFMGLENNFLLRGEQVDVNPRFEISGSNLQIFSTQTILSDRDGGNGPGKWYHVAIVFNGDATTIEEKYKMYINGIDEPLIFKNTGGEQSTIDLTYQNKDPAFMIGRAFDVSWRAFYGKIAEARIWRVARTAEQIKDNMCSLSDDYDAGDLVGRWLFNDGTETSAFSDLSGHNLDAVVHSNDDSMDTTDFPASDYVTKKCPE